MNRVLAPLARQVRQLIARAVVTLVDDGRKMQTVQVRATADEVLDDCEHWQGYGLSVHPHPGGEALLLAQGGGRGAPIVVAVADRRYRLTGLAAGEVAIHDDQGQTVILRRTGVEITAPQVTITGTLTVGGGLAVSGAGPSGKALAITGDLNLTGGLAATGALSAGSTLTAPSLTLGTRPVVADASSYLKLS